MTTEYNRAVLRVGIAQLAQQLGWNAIQGSPMELLTDVLERYILSLGRTTHRYSEQFGRTEPNLDDLGLAFEDHSIRLHELEDYVQHVEPISFAYKVPEYPEQRPSQLRFPKPNSRELAEREEHVHEHLPPMNPEWDEEIIETGIRTPIAIPGSNNVGTIPASMTTNRESPVSVGEKRAFTSPTDASANKKLKTLPDEAGRSQYQMKGVLMSDGGYLTPVRPGVLPDIKTPPSRLMSQSSVQSEVSVGSPPPHEESEGSPASSPPAIPASVMSETIDVQTHFGPVDDFDASKAKPPDLVLTGTEDIEKPKDSLPSEKVKTKQKGLKAKEKKGLLKGRTKGTEKSIKKKFKSREFILKKEDKQEPTKEVTVTSLVDQDRKKLKKKKLKMKTKPSLTIRTDLPSMESKSPRGGKSPRGRSPKAFKSPTISIVSPVSPRRPRSPRSPGRSPGRPPLQKSPGRSPKPSPGRSPGRPSLKSPLKTPKIGKSPEKVKVPKEKHSPGRPKKEGKPSKKDKSEKVSASLKKMLAKKQKVAVPEPPPPIVPDTLVAPAEPLAPVQQSFVDEPDLVFNIQPLPMDQIPPQTPSPAPTEAAEDEPMLSDYQNIDSPLPVPKPEEESAPEEIPALEKQEPEVEENPKTPALEITAVQSIPLDVYETPNGAAAAVSEDRDAKAVEEDDKESASSLWQQPVVTPVKKLEPFHFSASESDNDDNDFSFITRSIEEKIEHMNKETGKDGFTSDEDVFDILVGNDALSPKAGITPSVLVSPTASLMSPPKPDSPIKSPKGRGRPAKKEKTKLKIKKPKTPLVKKSELKSPKWLKLTIPKLTPTDIERTDYPSAKAAGLTITTPTSPPFSPPPTSSPPTVAPVKISIGGGTTKFTIKMGGKKDDVKSEEKKKKKKKNKDKDKERSKEERKKEKALKKQEKKLKKEKESHSIPKLKFKIGGGDSSASVSASPSKQESKSEPHVPKLLIKPMAPSPKPHPTSFSPVPTGLSPCPTKSPNFSSYNMSPLRPTSPSTSPSNSTMPRTPSPTPAARRSSVSPERSVLRSPSPASSSLGSLSPISSPSRFSATIPPPPTSSKSHTTSSAMPTKPVGNVLPLPPPSSTKTVAPIIPPLSSVKKGSRAIITETQGKIYDEKGNIIWICPTCKMPDDGSSMIGCDICDDWYHWVCVNITAEPTDEQWYCPRCTLKNQGGEEKKKRGRKPKAGRGRGKKKMSF